MKISAEIEIINNFKIINQKYYQNQKIKIISDKKLIQHLKNEIDVPNWVVDTRINNYFNSFLSRISKITRIVF